ncbi:hypothetical protein HDF26_004312 [Pedobacter cryoconitis]|uniref:hypothetical protein n=1 Tax=Pedobacter cryoconitis TaxID=188932 RepID=UPI001621D8D4|nr:hypothetical protein [Pedobacter cryoconitis]MBB6273839.1 hypothetical protein [Pedobacter cryoconitis]
MPFLLLMFVPQTHDKNESSTRNKSIRIGTILLFLFTTASFAQKQFTISGTLKDAQTGETLIGATIRIKELPQYSG